MTIHRDVLIPAEPARVYQVLADAQALSALCGMSGVPAGEAGEAFTAFDGHVTGRQIELVPGERIVQAWRFPVWASGTYSIVRFTLVLEGEGTRLSIDQDGVPEDWHEHVYTNWPTFYLDPLATHFRTAVVG
ncbi:SRPBCC domain-containing protein [Actinoplanes subtropicus]|uniref:SRPBCC domain-containing protein n=1 Tax=Actinoplanes subtropicus TaxID=543632 RepID=UPI0004C4067F|nr:SRPBCC domain-containing protein [Actinoplanes subtropicus]